MNATPEHLKRDRNGLLPGMLWCPKHGDYKPAPFPYHPGCPVCVYGAALSATNTEGVDAT